MTYVFYDANDNITAVAYSIEEVDRRGLNWAEMSSVPDWTPGETE